MANQPNYFQAAGQTQNVPRLQSLLGLLYPPPVTSPWPYNQQDYHDDVANSGRSARSAFDPTLPAALIRAKLSRNDLLRLREVAAPLDDWVVGTTREDWHCFMCYSLHAESTIGYVYHAAPLGALTVLEADYDRFKIRLRLDVIQSIGEVDWGDVVNRVRDADRIAVSVIVIEDPGNIATIWSVLRSVRIALEECGFDPSLAKVEYPLAGGVSAVGDTDLQAGLDITTEELLNWDEELQFVMDP